MKISELIDELISLKEQRTELANLDSSLSKRVSQLESDLMHAMNSAGTMKAASERGHSVTMSKNYTQPLLTGMNFISMLQLQIVLTCYIKDLAALLSKIVGKQANKSPVQLLLRYGVFLSLNHVNKEILNV